MARSTRAPRPIARIGLCARRPNFRTAASVLVHTAAALNWILTAHFLRLCVRRRSAPEPFWFPATVSLAGLALAGPKVGSPWALVWTSLVLGCAVALLLWPPCVWRVMTQPQVAPNPSIFVVLAPVPFVTMALFGARHSPHVPLLGTVGMDLFFVLNVLNVLIGITAAFQRRAALKDALWPVQPAWASLTFPMVSSCTVLVHFANEYQFYRAPG